MSTFDNPFDPDRRLHARAAVAASISAMPNTTPPPQLALQPAVDAPRRARYEGVVASAVMRAMFPQDVARRAFLKSVGAATARRGAVAILPAQDRDRSCSRKAGRSEKKDLKVGFIPITCATPIIMAAPMGFYAKNGLNVEVIKTAGWAVIRDKTINKEYDAAHMLSPMPLAITMGVGSNPIALHHAGGREHQRPGDHARGQAQGQARSEGLEGLQVRRSVRLLDAQLSAALLSRRARHRSRCRRADPRGAAAGNGRQSARRQYRRLPRARSDEPARGL